MKDRTVILVSHHVQLCAPGAKYIVALENGRAMFDGTYDEFQGSPALRGLIVSSAPEEEEIKDVKEEKAIEETTLRPEIDEGDHSSEEGSTAAPSTAGATVVEGAKFDKKPARKLVDEEKRAVGRISRDVWLTYLRACGASWYWLMFAVIFIVAALSPVLENGWLKYVFLSYDNNQVTDDAISLGHGLPRRSRWRTTPTTPSSTSAFTLW